MIQDNATIERSKAIKASFIEKLAKVDLRYAIAIPIVLGTAVVLSGVGVEVQHQSELLSQGFSTLQSYLSDVNAHQLGKESGISDYINASLSGEIPAAGAKIQAVGLSVLMYGTALSAAAATFTKGLSNVALLVQNKTREAINLRGNGNPQGVDLDHWRANRVANKNPASSEPEYATAKPKF